MCYHRSFVVTEDCKVLSHPASDHHTEIRKLHKIREEGLHATTPHCAIECNPFGDLFDLKTWDRKIDQPVKPDWWTTAHKKAIDEKLEHEFEQRASVKSRVYVNREGSIEVPHLKRTGGITLIASHMIYLRPTEPMVHSTIIAPMVIIDPRACNTFASNKIVCSMFSDMNSTGDRFEEFMKRTGQLQETDSEEQRFHELREIPRSIIENMGPALFHRKMPRHLRGYDPRYELYRMKGMPTNLGYAISNPAPSFTAQQMAAINSFLP